MAGFPKGKERKGDKAKRPMPGIPLDKSTIAKLIIESKGNVAAVADAMGSTRTSIRQVIDRTPELQELLKDMRERQLDELEDAVFTRAIEAQDTGLQCFLLKTQGKSRGYDQDEARHAAKEVANAAFEFIISKTKSST